MKRILTAALTAAFVVTLSPMCQGPAVSESAAKLIALALWGPPNLQTANPAQTVPAKASPSRRGGAVKVVIRVKSVTRTLSVYSDYYVGRKMSNGKPFYHNSAVCASNDWPLGTRLMITVGKRSLMLTVSDRMAKRFNRKRVDLPGEAWDYLSGGKKPGLIHGAMVEVLR